MDWRPISISRAFRPCLYPGVHRSRQIFARSLASRFPHWFKRKSHGRLPGPFFATTGEFRHDRLNWTETEELESIRSDIEVITDRMAENNQRE